MNNSNQARQYYMKACEAESRASIIWLEWSKLEEEQGLIDQALRVLIIGMVVCKLNESIFSRVIKLFDKMHKEKSIRGMLSFLKYDSIDRTWKFIMEGCLFEARVGNNDGARKILKYLMKHVPWHGPIYYEAFRLEELAGNDAAAKKIAVKGLSELKHYGPLWFGRLRIAERSDIKRAKIQWIHGIEPKLDNLHEECQEAVGKISKELTWKVFYERFQAEERAAEISALGRYRTILLQTLSPSSIRNNSKTVQLQVQMQDYRSRMHEQLLENCLKFMSKPCKKSLVQSLLLCPVSPVNLRWKLLLASAMFEVKLGKVTEARKLINRAFAEVPVKSRSTVFIICSRVEEFVGNVNAARHILSLAKQELYQQHQEAQQQASQDWKAHLESILLEMRAGKIIVAIKFAEEAVSLHPGAGRLWALYIQLYHRLEGEMIIQNFKRKLMDLENRRRATVVRDLGASFEDQIPRNPLCQENSHDSATSLSSFSATSFEERKTSTSTRALTQKDIALRKAITEVPKSGEVWCEIARCVLNPFDLEGFDLASAIRACGFATSFTPQFGDTFMECLRVELLVRVFLPQVCEAIGVNYQLFAQLFLLADEETDIYKLLSTPPPSLSQAKETVASKEEEEDNDDKQDDDYNDNNNSRDDDGDEVGAVIRAIDSLQYNFSVAPLRSFQYPQLLRRCINADPNHGLAWFHCRECPHDTPQQIMRNAQRLISHELCSTNKLYTRAMMHYIYRAIETARSKEEEESSSSSRLLQQLLAASSTRSFLRAYHRLVLHCDAATTTATSPSPLRQYRRAIAASDDITASEEGELLQRVALMTVVDGQAYRPGDFVTGIVELTRSLFQLPHHSPHNYSSPAVSHRTAPYQKRTFNRQYEDNELLLHRRKFLLGMDPVIS